MVKIYTNKTQGNKTISLLDLLSALLGIALMVFIFIAIYVSQKPHDNKAHYNFDVVIQYENVYQLLSSVHHSDKDDSGKWVKELQDFDEAVIHDFCEVIKGTMTEPVIQESEGLISSVTEFECKGSGP